MALFAKLNENNVVLEVNVLDDADVQYLQFPASEPVGVAFLTAWSGGYLNWKQTSDLALFRGRYAAIGFIYDPVLDAFYPPSPFTSWVFNSTTFSWEPPIAYPTDNKYYLWNEEQTNWVEVTI